MGTDSDNKKKDRYYFSLIKSLSNTRKNISDKLAGIFRSNTISDKELINDIEEILLTADVGVSVTDKIISKIKKLKQPTDENQIISIIKNEMIDILKMADHDINRQNNDRLKVIMIVGVNGVGKTTTVGKLAAQSISCGESVIIAAADTFRSAAIEQLEVWAKRVGADIIKNQKSTDPSSVVFDSLDAAIARKKDLLIIDTAGRLHNKEDLMKELAKMRKVIFNKIDREPDETLLVMDATTGQNGLNQASEFYDKIKITGIIITKLDGSAKAGVIFSITEKLKIPIRYIGIGEQVDDLKKFDSQDFVDALFESAL